MYKLVTVSVLFLKTLPLAHTSAFCFMTQYVQLFAKLQHIHKTHYNLAPGTE